MIRSRFAPSPTGLLHIGNARSAALNWAYIKNKGGEFVLRIDDTDTERSKKSFESQIKEDLTWLGITWDKTFNQSDRKDVYYKKIQYLKDKKRIYPCFETPEELSLKKKSLLSSGKPPIYDRSALKLSSDEISLKIKSGIKPHWRFKLEDKEILWNDLIKGTVKFNTKNLSDPILIREDGSLLYHLPSVIDDIEEDITDIIRGEDHITNTAYHIQIFDALKSKAPNFAHHPFLTDEHGKGFGKRIGSLSIDKLKEEGFENVTILNYLMYIGSSKDIKVETNIEDILKNFDIKNISTSSCKFSFDILKSLNSDTIKSYSFNNISARLDIISNNISKEKFWRFSKNNLNFFLEIKEWERSITSVVKIENYNIDKKLITAAIENIPPEPFVENSWDLWVDAISKASGFKGKDLFMPLRIILTGLKKGPELKYFMPLVNKDIILRKFGKL